MFGVFKRPVINVLMLAVDRMQFDSSPRRMNYSFGRMLNAQMSNAAFQIYIPQVAIVNFKPDITRISYCVKSEFFVS